MFEQSLKLCKDFSQVEKNWYSTFPLKKKPRPGSAGPKCFFMNKPPDGDRSGGSTSPPLRPPELAGPGACPGQRALQKRHSRLGCVLGVFFGCAAPKICPGAFATSYLDSPSSKRPDPTYTFSFFFAAGATAERRHGAILGEPTKDSSPTRLCSVAEQRADEPVARLPASPSKPKINGGALD